MDYLIFQLRAPLSSWGDTAVGEYRGSHTYPGESALIGLLGAALGLRREDETAHAALRDAYGFAVGVQQEGTLLRDYHTAQVPGRTTLKGRPHRTRRDELAMRRDELNTILSSRDYRQNAACLVAVQGTESAPYKLRDLAGALRTPRFVLYLGRKSCPPSEPLFPRVVSADSVLDAFRDYQDQLDQAKSVDPSTTVTRCRIVRVAWGEGIHAGFSPDLSVIRKDKLVRRLGWQFSDRSEFVKILEDA